jgi:aspartyl-tRNA(Asn)/glutamyl-tRNA(Gln) amidotransferase subunit C
LSAAARRRPPPALRPHACRANQDFAMNLSREDVIKIAHLARLALTEDEILAYQEQLSAILDYAERLNALDLSGVEPSAHAVARTNVLREDVIVPGLALEDALYNAAATADDQFLIQSVLDE